MKTKRFIAHSDAGHGWLAVKRKLLSELNILDKITSYSYQKGQTVYLEEDCDATTFIKAIDDVGIPYEIVSSKSRNGVSPTSPIRNYERFSL